MLKGVNKSEELYLCIAEQEERKPEIAIADKFEVYKQIRNKKCKKV